jgi:hypothetical protein
MRTKMRDTLVRTSKSPVQMLKRRKLKRKPDL